MTKLKACSLALLVYCCILLVGIVICVVILPALTLLTGALWINLFWFNRRRKVKLNTNNGTSQWIHVSINDNPCHVHYLVTKSHNSNARSIILVHGTGGSAFTSFQVLIEKLSAEFHVFAVDMPGFGVSSCPQELKKASPDETHTWYSEFFKVFVQELQLEQPSVLAHSMGAFFIVKTAYQYPQLFERLVLVDPAGLLPTLGNQGMFWALLFKSGVPQSVFRMLGKSSTWLFQTWFDVLSVCPETIAWYNVNSSREAINDSIVARYIDMKFTESYWKFPAAADLFRLTIPVSFIYGEHDTIMPVEQGLLFSQAVGSTIPVSIIPKTFHSPMESVQEFYDVFSTIHIFNKASFATTKTNVIVEYLQQVDNSLFASTFDLNATQDMIDDFYSILLVLGQKSNVRSYAKVC